MSTQIHNQTEVPVILREQNPTRWLSLYGATFAVHWVCAGARTFVSYEALWLAFTVLRRPKPPYLHTLAILIGYGPLALSAATLLLPLGGWLWQQRIGARNPSPSELETYEQSLAQLRAVQPSLRPPWRWCVLDSARVSAAVYADTLMLTRGLLESRHLTAVLAHELGHLNTNDVRLATALVRMTIPPRTEVRRGFRTIALIATGALATSMMRIPWAVYWRAREYAADQYAANLGQAQPLALFLDEQVLSQDLPDPFPWLITDSHLVTEGRVDRIESLLARQ